MVKPDLRTGLSYDNPHPSGLLLHGWHWRASLAVFVCISMAGMVFPPDKLDAPRHESLGGSSHSAPKTQKEKLFNYNVFQHYKR